MSLLKFILITNILLFLFSVGQAQNTKSYGVSYRIIRASPQEFTSAIFSPYAPPASHTLPTSRLEQFFRIKSKVFRNDEVTIDFIPTIPIIGDIASTEPIRVILKMITHNASNYQLNAKFQVSAKKFVNTMILISPVEVGSLLSLEVTDSNIDPKTLSMFQFVARQLGFISDTPPAFSDTNSHFEKTK